MRKHLEEVTEIAWEHDAEEAYRIVKEKWEIGSSRSFRDFLNKEHITTYQRTAASHRDDKGVEEKEVRNYRVKERKTPDGRIQLTGSEDAEQEKVVCWAKLMSNAYPDLELLYHVPNGGSRNKAEASKLRRMGVRAGVPDLVLPVPRAGYAGLYIELKVGENRPSNSQKDWLEKLTIQGYQALVCYGGNEAIRALQQYITASKTALVKQNED